MKSIHILLFIIFTFSACKKDNNDIDDHVVTDVDGNIYGTVRIGTQVWMTENLKVTKYRNGDLIDTLSSSVCAEDSPKYQWACNNEEDNVGEYGRVYTWYVILDSRGLCPSGWHVPSDNEWKTLEMELGMSQYEADDIGFRGEDEGSQLAGYPSLWEDGLLESSPAFDESGFKSLPGGHHHCVGSYYGFGENAAWWTADETSVSDAWYRYMHYNFNGVFRNSIDKNYGYSVRCVKN